MRDSGGKLAFRIVVWQTVVIVCWITIFLVKHWEATPVELRPREVNIVWRPAIPVGRMHDGLSTWAESSRGGSR